METTRSEQEIRMRSYLIWEREGRPPGRSDEFWFRAKVELEEEFSARCRAAEREANYIAPHPAITTRPVRRVAA